MKNYFLCVLLSLGLVSCGYVQDKLGAEDGDDGAQGPAGEAGEAGEDAVVKSEVCKIELIYPGDTAKYKMVYVKLTFGGGHSLASLRQYNVATKKIVTQVSAAFEAGEEPWLESPNWHVSGSELTLKPSGTKYSLKCS